MSKKILIIEGLVVAAILALNWSASRDLMPVGAAPATPAAESSNNTIDLERPPFLD